ncbi:MAG TPA: hypothetical protein VJ251_15685, partial [Stellaceae bacterium]|nr:hypothetical protein [Stellaceae bacterium]
ELNPDEMVWNYVKRTGTAKRPLNAGEVLQDRIEVDLQAVQDNPAIVRSFFNPSFPLPDTTNPLQRLAMAVESHPKRSHVI